MLFNSISYLIFLPIVFTLFWVCKDQYRWILLLVASYYFYMSWNPKYIVLIVFTTVVSYVVGRLLEKQKDKRILVAGILIHLVLLGVFKYFNFMSDSIAAMLHAISIPVHEITIKIFLPVGISFYTFQSIGYMVDVYRGEVEPEHHFGRFALFISFFPQLVAGPIERSKNLMLQLRKKFVFEYDKAAYGLRLIGWGLFKKMVISDSVSLYVDRAYNNVQWYQGFTFVAATVLFAIQIYCDFSGYSDIAIGTAKLFGIDLMTNFRSPYFSTSIKEFWVRWHISLSSWFRDYLYIPLGGNRVSKQRHCFNLMVTFLVSGLWHGANWTFVIWGGLHGFYQVIEKFLPKKREKHPIIFTILTFSLVCFSYIFFRANSLSDAVYIIRNLFVGIGHPALYIARGLAAIQINSKVIVITMAIKILILAMVDYFMLKKDVFYEISKRRPVARWAVYSFLLVALLSLAVNSGSQEFIYFQF